MQLSRRQESIGQSLGGETPLDSCRPLTEREERFAVLDKLISRRRKVSDDAIAAMYKAGHGSLWIAERIGVHHSTVLRAVKRAGIPRRPVGQRSHAICRKCSRPAGKFWTGKGFYGALCAWHYRLAHAAASRKYLRKKKNIPRNRWRVPD